MASAIAALVDETVRPGTVVKPPHGRFLVSAPKAAPSAPQPLRSQAALGPFLPRLLRPAPLALAVPLMADLEAGRTGIRSRSSCGPERSRSGTPNGS